MSPPDATFRGFTFLFVTTLQENNAESALEALKELQSDTAKTLRDGKLVRPRGVSEPERRSALLTAHTRFKRPGV